MFAVLLRLLTLLGFAFLLSGSLAAQLLDGAVAPEITSATWLNTKKPFTLEGFQGRPVMLVFWDKIDHESMVDGPPMSHYWQPPEEPGAVMISVTAESPEVVKPFLEKFEIHYPVATNCRLAELYGVADRSYLFVIGWDGRIFGSTSRASKHSKQLAASAHKEAKDHSHIWDPRPLPEGVDLDNFLKYCLSNKMSKAEKALEKALDKLDDSEGEAINNVGGLMVYQFVRPIMRMGYIMDLAVEQGRAYEATQLCKRSADAFKGTDVDDDFNDIAKTIKKDLKAVYALDKKRVAAVEKAFHGDRDGALAGLRALEEKVQGTILEEFLKQEILYVESMGVFQPVAE